MQKGALLSLPCFWWYLEALCGDPTDSSTGSTWEDGTSHVTCVNTGHPKEEIINLIV